MSKADAISFGFHFQFLLENKGVPVIVGIGNIKKLLLSLPTSFSWLVYHIPFLCLSSLVACSYELL